MMNVGKNIYFKYVYGPISLKKKKSSWQVKVKTKTKKEAKPNMK